MIGYDRLTKTDMYACVPYVCLWSVGPEIGLNDLVLSSATREYAVERAIRMLSFTRKLLWETLSQASDFPTAKIR